MSDTQQQSTRQDEQDVAQSLYEVRRKIYPRSVTGVFANWRWILVVLTQLFFYGMPWLNWNGRQAFLLDLAARKFYIFGLVLWPQDVIYLTVLLLIAAFSLFLFTAIAGRLFCGYACPQTVYSEIFMWIERKVEGDRFARLRLDSDPWSLRKLRIKATKQLLWIAVALWTGFTFVGFFTPIRELGNQILTLTLGPWQLFWLLFYSFATWGNAGFMREQVCKYMCPYARFQSVMVDHDTYVVTYDTTRGEPRGGRSKKVDYKAQGLGACVDCGICVQVCPTGIDIRNGLQYECIGCGACIDACDQVMEKLDYPKGLVRYTSEYAMTHKLDRAAALKRVLRPRVLIYIGIWIALIAALVVSLSLRNPLRVDVLRDGGMAREVGYDQIENVYSVQLMNASEQSMRLHVRAEGAPDLQVVDEQGAPIPELEVPALANKTVLMKVRVPTGTLDAGSHKIRFVFEGRRDGDEQPVGRVQDSTFLMQL